MLHFLADDPRNRAIIVPDAVQGDLLVDSLVRNRVYETKREALEHVMSFDRARDRGLRGRDWVVAIDNVDHIIQRMLRGNKIAFATVTGD